MGLWNRYHRRATARLWEVVQRKGRWREIHGVGLCLGMSEVPPASQEPGEQRGCPSDPLLPASGDSGLLERAFDGRERGWRWQPGQGRAGTGRERQQSLGGSNLPEQTRPHRAHPLSLPPPANHFRGTNTSIPSPRWHRQHLDRASTCHSGYLYIPVQGEKSNNLHTVTETASTGTAREGSQSLSAKQAPRNPHCPGELL